MPGPGQGGAAEDRAPFDDTAEALRFALNAHQVSVPVSYMNRVLSEFTPEPKRKRPSRAERAVLIAIGVSSLDQLREKMKGTRKASLVRRPPRPTRGLDSAHLAGFILRELGKLSDGTQTVLTGLCTNPVVPCDCGRPCCSRWEPVARWVQAVDRTCEALKTRAILDANPGINLEALEGGPNPMRMKAGLSTQPALRRTLVKDWYTGERGRSLVDLARGHGLTEKTVATHRGWIHEWLDAQEAKAWEEANWWFDQVGITGPWL